jgi:N-acetylneuraminic acid mutarotase
LKNGGKRASPNKNRDIVVMLRKYYLPVFVAGLLSLAIVSCTKRKPEEIDYAPNTPFNPYPADSATNINHTTLDVTLSWSATDPNSGDVLTYAVYLDTLDPPLTTLASGLSATSYYLTGLSYNTTYYWNLYITDSKGVTTSGPVWHFTTLPHANTAPNIPVYLYPSNGSAWQYPTLNFGVNCTDPEGGSDTLYYDQYLGVTTLPPLSLFRNDPACFWEYVGLNYTTTYYWRVDARDNHYAYTSGPLFSFTTRDCPWFYKRELPSPRYGFGTAVVNNKIYVIGGTDGTSYLDEVLEYDPLLDTWTSKAHLPTARSDLAVTVWNGKIYALGGVAGDSKFRNNEVYDPLSDTWDSLTPSPGAFTWSTANAVHGKIYFIGGTLSMGFISTGIFEYNTATGTWWDTTTYWNDTLWTDTTYTIVDTIISDSSRTSSKSALPENKLFHCSSVCNDLIYVMGGSTVECTFPPAVDVYHPATNVWSEGREMIGPVRAPAAVTVNNFIYVVGGYDGGTSSKRVRKYDPVSDTWQVRSDLQKERSFFGAAFINNRIFAIGGLSVIPLATVEEYRLDLDPKNIVR